MKTKNILIILGIFVAILIIILAFLQLSGTVNFLAIAGYETVYKANWGHICCEEGAYEPKYIRYADDVPSYDCDAYTDECRIQIDVLDPPLWNLNMIVVKYDICNLDGSNCVEYSYIGRDGDTRIIYVGYGKKINFINPGIGWDHRAYYKYSADFRKFYIQGEENGKVYVSKSCILNSDLKKRVLAGGLNELSKVGMNRCQNYITDYILVDTKTYTYLFREVLCQARNIYEIDKINLLDGSTRKIQGERIKDVECCPAEANCGDNFKWKEVEKDCPLGYDYECPNGGEPIAITGTSYVTYSCISGMCVQSNPFNVECTNNAICVDKYNNPSMVCKNFKCVKDDDWVGHCGDGICESILGETATSCPEDCGDWEDEFNFNWLYLIPILLTLGLAGLFGWRGKSRTGKYYWLDFVIGGVLGLGIGFLLYWIFSNWLVVLLVGLIGGGGLIFLLFLIGGIPLLLFLLNLLTKGAVLRGREEFRKFKK